MPQSAVDDEADYTIEVRDKSSKCMVLVEGERAREMGCEVVLRSE